MHEGDKVYEKEQLSKVACHQHYVNIVKVLLHKAQFMRLVPFFYLEISSLQITAAHTNSLVLHCSLDEYQNAESHLAQSSELLLWASATLIK